MKRESAIVIGAGGISSQWFSVLAKENVDVLAVVDLRLENAQKRVKEFNLSAEASTDMDAMLAKHKADFVIDLTVPESHCAVTCAAMRAGFHVVSEKPMAATMTGARKMVRTSEQTGRLYMVSQTRRWENRHDQVKRSVADGKIGGLTAINCDFYIGAHFGGFRDEMPSPLILDMAIHHFDLCRNMAGVDATAVYAREFNPKGSWYKGDVAASCIFEMSSGAVFTYRGSWCAEGCHTSWNGDWRLIGDQGTMLMEHDQPPRGQVLAGSEGFHRPLKDLEPSASPLEFTGWHGVLREMLDFLRTGKTPQTECHDNIRSLAMVFAVIESARKGRRVLVKA